MLQDAAYEGHAATVKIILDELKKSSLEKLYLEDDILDAFYYGIRSGSTAVVAHFIDYGVDPTKPDPRQETALHMASFYGQEKVSDYLYHRFGGLGLGVRNSRNDTPLAVALRENHKAIIRKIMQARHAVVASVRARPKERLVEDAGNDRYSQDRYRQLLQKSQTGLYRGGEGDWQGGWEGKWRGGSPADWTWNRSRA